MTRDMLEKWQLAAIEAYKQQKTDINPALTQNVFLAEIALQLAGINEKLTTITERGGSADLQGSALDDIAKMLHIIADKK